ncbi:MAG: hypothetical protein K2O83_11960, partial [Schaedlerella arabinosiphila]|nr:hypothetical protein [Schaedlerella arabinosiphila]
GISCLMSLRLIRVIISIFSTCTVGCSLSNRTGGKFLSWQIRNFMLCLYTDTKREAGFMFWKMTNLQLKKGNIFPLYGDSAPFFRRICGKTDMHKPYI